MTVRPLAFAGAAVLAFATAPAPAQQLPAAAPSSASTAALVGRWLYDSRGGIIGSVKSVSPDGRTATIVLGIYRFDNVRVVEVPASTLSIVDGKVTLRGESAEALNAFPLR